MEESTDAVRCKRGIPVASALAHYGSWFSAFFCESEPTCADGLIIIGKLNRYRADFMLQSYEKTTTSFLGHQTAFGAESTTSQLHLMMVVEV
jgi:hypothetical protein